MAGPSSITYAAIVTRCRQMMICRSIGGRHGNIRTQQGSLPHSLPNQPLQHHATPKHSKAGWHHRPPQNCRIPATTHSLLVPVVPSSQCKFHNAAPTATCPIRTVGLGVHITTHHAKHMHVCASHVVLQVPPPLSCSPTTTAKRPTPSVLPQAAPLGSLTHSVTEPP